MTKADYKKTYKDLYNASTREPAIVKVPALQFAMVDGAGGDPAKNPDFQHAVDALYGVSFTVKFAMKSPSLRS